MKIIVAPDSFKGSMTSAEVIMHIRRAAKECFGDADIVEVPIADGGEGTVESLVRATGGEMREVIVSDPVGRPVKAAYGIINRRSAVIEMAQASGLPLLKRCEQNPLAASTYGTGQLIKAALDEGIRDIIIGIGGSATNDGGIGASQALGIRFLDENGADVGRGGMQLGRIRSISTEGMDPRIAESKITVICDVNNPLTGEKGATYVYGPQKGASPEMLKTLEEGMISYHTVIKKQFGLDMDSIPGAGAAGGLGAALVAFFGGILKPGIEAVLDLVEFDRLLEGADLVVTGEGRIDAQSAFGKVPVGVARRCTAKGVPAVAIAGGMGKGAENVYEYGIDSIMVTVNTTMSLDEAILRSGELLYDASLRMFKFIKLGIGINKLG